MQEYSTMETIDEFRETIAHLIHTDSVLKDYEIGEDQDVWERRMSQPGEYCDNVFIKLAANYLQRDIILIPVVPEDRLPIRIESENSSEKAYHLLYFPEGPKYYGESAHYQSILLDDQLDSTSVFY